ncbi:MAG: N-acetylmuramic acid 6-phosphate etherase [Chitinophagales bacterium]|nr:N-acetylmuramic acid 6-phosphate etherase [Chitinophagales bacterium]
MERVTEQSSLYRHLEQMAVRDLLEHINEEDHKVAPAVKLAIPAIEALVNDIVDRMLSGGRLFYIGSGTSGRLGIVDASECPPTFGVPQGMVVGLIAGGDGAIRQAVEGAEDDPNQGWKDLQQYAISNTDVVVGIAASGTTPYVINALRSCQQQGILTGCITCNPHAPISQVANHAIEVVTGPEFVTGSTRMKAGTAQKLVLNMISTSVMIKLGRVQDNKMVDMQLSNDKLVDRGARMLVEALRVDYETAKSLLLLHGSVRKAMNAHQQP